jgi:hypothetical protein
MEPPPPPARDGRTLGWRVGTALSGAAVAGAGVAVVAWPWLVGWVVGGALASVGVLLVVSAFAARGR